MSNLEYLDLESRRNYKYNAEYTNKIQELKAKILDFEVKYDKLEQSKIKLGIFDEFILSIGNEYAKVCQQIDTSKHEKHKLEQKISELKTKYDESAIQLIQVKEDLTNPKYLTEKIKTLMLSDPEISKSIAVSLNISTKSAHSNEKAICEKTTVNNSYAKNPHNQSNKEVPKINQFGRELDVERMSSMSHLSSASALKHSIISEKDSHAEQVLTF